MLDVVSLPKQINKALGTKTTCLDIFCFLCPEISKQEVTILAGVIDIYQGRGKTSVMMGAERNMWGTQMISLVDSWYSLAQL